MTKRRRSRSHPRKSAVHPSMLGERCVVCNGHHGAPADCGAVHGLVLADGDIGFMCHHCFEVTEGTVVGGWAS